MPGLAKSRNDVKKDKAGWLHQPVNALCFWMRFKGWMLPDREQQRAPGWRPSQIESHFMRPTVVRLTSLCERSLFASQSCCDIIHGSEYPWMQKPQRGARRDPELEGAGDCWGHALCAHDVIRMTFVVLCLSFPKQRNMQTLYNPIYLRCNYNTHALN